MIINGKALLELSPIKDMIPHKVTGNLVSHGLSEGGYDIRIKQTIQFIGNGKLNYIPYLDPEATGENRIGFQRTGGDFAITISPNEPTINKGRFTLASAMEEFDMPDNLIGIVHDKSTWARQGLSVFNTVIESGWKGFLTLELVYHGNSNLVIPAGSGIAQVVFHETKEPRSYSGKYQNQKDEPTESKFT